METENSNVIIKPKKYFFCFGFKEFSLKDLDKFHVTLIYLGAEFGWNIEQAISKVDQYLSSTFTTRFEIEFLEPQLFGRNKDIPVLLPTFPANITDELFHKELANELSCFQQGNQFPFNMHLSTDLAYFKGNVDCLYLCSQGYEVHKKWEL